MIEISKESNEKSKHNNRSNAIFENIKLSKQNYLQTSEVLLHSAQSLF